MGKYLKIMRPSHWTKNVFVFAGLIFGRTLAGSSQEVIIAIASAIGGFVCFCLASSSIYVFNDIMDRTQDQLHPEKKYRPVASGQITPGFAGLFSIILAATAIVCSYMLSTSLAKIIVIYIALMVFYSLFLKSMMIVDCIVISLGFVLRAIAGAIVVGVFISPWLVICTFALCLFLGFSKRRSEVAQLGRTSNEFRNTLAGYTPELLAHMVDVTSGLAIVTFLLYGMSERTLHTFGTNNLVYTTPIVLYCIFRFSALIQKGNYSGPVSLILRDLPFQIGAVLWVLACIFIIYFNDTIGGVWTY